MSATTHITPDGRSRLLGVLLASLMLRALRAAASPSLPLPLADGEDAARNACGVPETATPGAATPGAALPINLETESMNTLPRPDVLALSKDAPAPEIGCAQHKALLRWHANRPLANLAFDMALHAQFPLIPCNPDVRARKRTGGAA